MGLREQRIRFTQLKAQLILWIPTIDGFGKVEVAEDEGTIHSPRLVRIGTSGPRVFANDAVHKGQDKETGRGGFHPQGLACDLLIYIDGTYVEDGEHLIWGVIDEKARTMDPMFGMGLSFNDANHLSLGESKGK